MNNNDEVYVVVLRDEDGLLSTRRIWGYDSFKRGVVGKRGRFTYDGIEIVNFLSGYNFEILEKKAITDTNIETTGNIMKKPA